MEETIEDFRTKLLIKWLVDGQDSVDMLLFDPIRIEEWPPALTLAFGLEQATIDASAALKQAFGEVQATIEVRLKAISSTKRLIKFCLLMILF